MIRSPSIHRFARWRRLAGVLVASLAMAGCSKSASSVPNLAGKWRIELRSGSLPLWMPSGAPHAIAIVEVRPDTTAADTKLCRDNPREPECLSAVVGSFRLEADDGFPPVFRKGEAGMIVDSEGGVIFVLGPCCDRGRIGARGAFDGERIRGGWSQEFVGEGPGGRFEMTRIR